MPLSDQLKQLVELHKAAEQAITTREKPIHRILPVALYKIKHCCYLVAARVNKPRCCYDFSSSAY